MSSSKSKKSSLLDSSKPTLDPAARPPPQLFQPDSLPTSSIPVSSSLPSSSAPRAVHGNYLHYYERRNTHPDARDERLNLIPKEWIRGKKVLDVGCNAGQVTIELARDYGAGKVTGVDIDKDLIRKSKGNVDLAWSRQKTLKRLLDESTALSTCRKRRSRSPSSSSLSSSLQPLPKTRADPSPFLSTDPLYFPASLGRMFGYLPPPKGLLSYHSQPNQTSGVSGGGGKKGRKSAANKEWPVEIKSFPENVKFLTADWVNEEIESDRESYDIIIAFSVTKWIHLQSLNAGLLTFFQKVFQTLSPGGRFVLEPQPFSTYARSAKTTSLELRENFELLKSGAQKGWRWEEGDFERVLIELVGFEKRESLGETGKIGSTFRRPVEVYTKRGGTATLLQ